MKKSVVVLLAAFILSSLSFAKFNDLPENHWASQAVINLYEKGLLTPTLNDNENFEGNGVFSRYEIASMLYLNLKYIENNIPEKASKKDLILLKALVEDLTPELSKISSKTDDLDERIDDLETKIDKRLTRRVDSLEERVQKVKISGEFKAEQIIGLKENNPGMEELELDGDINIVGNPSDNVSVLTRLGVEEGNSAEIEAVEFKAKSDKLSVTAFKDSDKDPESLLSFSNTLSLFDGNTVAPKSGILFNGMNRSQLIDTRYVGMLFKTGSGDFYGAQIKNDINPWKKRGLNSFVRVSYAEKIGKYQYVDEDDPENGKAFYSIDTENILRIGRLASITLAGEYATRRGPGVENIDSPTNEAFVNSRDALYTYASGNLKLGIIGSFSGVVGLYNSGEYFDLSGISNTNKELFSETDIVSLEGGRKGYLLKVGYDLFGKGWLKTNLTYASDGTNVKTEIPEEHIVLDSTLNLIPGKIRMNGEVRLEKDEQLIADLDDNVYRVEEEDGKLIINSDNKFSLVPGMIQNVNLTYEDDLDKDNRGDTENIIEIYVDNSMNLSDNLYLKFVGEYKKEGLKDLGEIEEEEDGAMVTNDYTGDEETKFESGAVVEISNMLKGTLYTGGRFSFEDKLGQEKNDDGEDTTLVDDKRNYSVFAAHEVEFGDLTVIYGGKFGISKEYAQSEDKLLDDDDSDDLKYAIGFKYDFGEDIIGELNYGDPKITDNDDDFMLEKTSFAEGEQDQLSVKIEAKF